jgi:acetyl esterase/lipase
MHIGRDKIYYVHIRPRHYLLSQDFMVSHVSSARGRFSDILSSGSTQCLGAGGHLSSPSTIFISFCISIMHWLFKMFARTAKIGRFILLQILQRNVISIKRSWLFSPATQPDAWKAITSRTYLYPSRVFRPSTKQASSVPLIIMVHGGGFIMNNPSVDDPLARFLADSCDCIVISIDYRKAPRHRFPAAYEDTVGSILDLLGEGGNDLPIDKNKVILLGSSAGGNLVLAAGQDARLHQKLLGIVALYPVVNLIPTAEVQMATRPDASVPDLIGPMWNDVLDIYAGTTDVAILQDPRLSPTNFKKRDDLPKYIFMLGCEHDMLCHEAKVMAGKLIDAAASQSEQASDGQQVGDVLWKLIEGQPHAFEHFATKPEDKEVTRLNVRDSMYQDIAQWLKGVFGTV